MIRITVKNMLSSGTAHFGGGPTTKRMEYLVSRVLVHGAVWKMIQHAYHFAPIKRAGMRSLALILKPTQRTLWNSS